MSKKEAPLWTKKEETVLADLTKSNFEVAKELGRTVDSVRSKRNHMRRQKDGSGLDRDRERHGDQYWSTQYKKLRQKYENLLEEQTAVDRLVGTVKELAPKSYDPAPSQLSDQTKRTGQAQSAVLLLSDTHVGKVITPDQTLGFGGYDFRTFLCRLKFLEDAVSSIIKDHNNTKLRELVLCLGGDMLDGALVHSVEAGQKNTLFSQFYGAGHAIAQFIRNLSSRVETIRVYCTVGNHTRWANQHKMPTENRFSNLDQFLFAYIQALTSSLGNVKWRLDRQPTAIFDVSGFTFQLLHGDTLRGGDRALGIPNHAVGRMVSSTVQLFDKYGLKSPDYYLCGHLHRSIVLPHAKGSFIVGGGFPGIDGYALANGFSPVDPTQVFFFVHPTYGKTATYEISLKLADPKSYRAYKMPEDLEMI